MTCLEDIKLRGERVAILAQFMETMTPAQAIRLIEVLREQNIISNIAASLLCEHVAEAGI